MRPFRLTSPTLNENDTEKACLDLLAIRGYFVLRIHAGTFKSPDGKYWIKGAKKGTADYIAVHKRQRGFLLETKRPAGELAEVQKARAKEIFIGYGIPTVKADSARELREFLDEWESKGGADQAEARPAHG